jgi:ketosteroid isomerase-like protein
VRQIQQTELAFAQAVSQTGIAAGFRRYAAPGAIMFLPDPAPAIPYLQTAHSPGELVWRAQYIGVAPSDDLAFSLGPSLYRAGKTEGGFYLTIWKRGSGGDWLFVLDHSVDMPAVVFEGPPAPVTVFAIDPAARPDQSQGLREADAGLDMALSKGPPESAFEPRLDDQALVVRANRPVASGKRKALKLLAEAPPIVEAQLLNAGLSADGLLGYTYGKARWTTAAGMQPGYYARVWRNTGQGWRLLVDHLAER